MFRKCVLSVSLFVFGCALPGCQGLRDVIGLIALVAVANGVGSSHGALDVVGIDESGAEVPVDCDWSFDDKRVQIAAASHSTQGSAWSQYVLHMPIESDGSIARCQVGSLREEVVLRAHE